MSLFRGRAGARHVLPLGFALVLALVLAMTALGIARMFEMESRLERLAGVERVKTALAARMSANMHERAQIARAIARGQARAADGVARYDGLARDDARAVADWQALPIAEDERAALQETLRAEAAARDVHREVLAAAERGGAGAGVAQYRARADIAEAAWEDALYRLLQASVQAAMNVVDEARAATRAGLLLIGLVGVLLIAIGAVVSIAVTGRVRRTERELQREKELAQVTLHSIGDGVITTDAHGSVEYLNPVAERYTGWTTAEARGRPLGEIFRIVDERTGASVVPVNGMPAPGPAEEEGPAVRLVDRLQRECPVRYSQAPIRGRDGSRHGSILVFHDISQVRAMAQQLLWQASHDALTGLVNRREFERRLAELAETARNQSRQHALLYMDLDNFKAVNDTCGHVAGDELLRQLTAVMLTRMRGSDTLARLGGDEFGALLESCPVDQAVRIANGIREAVREFRFVWESRTFSVGVSIGVVPIDATSDSPTMLLNRADACCYEAKNRGRDRVQVYRPEVDDQLARTGELRLIAQINHAFGTGGFELYRQAIVPLHGACGGRSHYEILVRMKDDEGNVVPPSAFMPAAERYNLLTSIDRWVISSLVEHLHRLLEQGRLPANQAECSYYAVNLSGASVNDKSFPDFLRNLLTRYALPPGVLCFEITETTAIANLSKAAELMHEFRALGCRFSLDDFGTGMSSFAYLKYLPVDTLKIAGMFVKDMATDAMDAAIVEAINRISHILGMQTVAESVESEATLAAVSLLGIDFAQGYHIAEPEALEAATRAESVAAAPGPDRRAGDAQCARAADPEHRQEST